MIESFILLAIVVQYAVCRKIPLYFSADLFGGVYADPVLRRAA